ncbi:TPA: citrate lyase holo-[acyl-carrier protein] synthase [Vibrio cholerae]
MASSARQIILSEKKREFSVIDKLVKQDPAGCVIGIGVNLVYSARERLPVSDFRKYALQKSCAAFLKAGITFTQYVDSEFTFLLATSPDAQSIKRICCDIEEGNRLLDIDVYDVHGCVSRLDIGLTERKCFLCGNAASWCIFNQAHSAEELLKYTLTTYKQMMDEHEK